MPITITGKHPIEEILKNPPKGCVVFLQKGSNKYKHLENQALSFPGVTVKKVDKAILDKNFPNNDGIAVKYPENNSSSILHSKSVKEFFEEESLKDTMTIIALDGITDPHNVGAIIRSADLLGCSLIIIPERRNAHINETVMKTSSGAAKYVPVASSVNLARDLEYLKHLGFWIYGADMGGEDIGKTDFTKKRVIVMGSEGYGMRELIKRTCDKIVSIPMKGHIDSLNVSVAAGIILYQINNSATQIN